jgi:inorganic pyrophosphatase
MSEHVEVTVEVLRGSRNKYACQPGRPFRLDRVLFSSVHYPTDYGVVEGTRAEDASRWTRSS